MKTLPSLLLASALTIATATTVSAYSLSPPDTSAKLVGKLTFYPENGAPSYQCKVTFFLKTKGFIKSVTVDTSGACQALDFGDLPWRVGVVNANTAVFGTVIFTGPGGGCSQGGVTAQINSAGVWSLPLGGGTCIAGTLISRPPVTIAP